MKMIKYHTGESSLPCKGVDTENKSQPRPTTWTTEEERNVLRDLGNGASLQAVMRLHGISLEKAVGIQSLIDA